MWEGERLVGGMYGVAQGTLFCGESMFSRAVNASKTALLVFCQAFAQRGGRLIDCQVLNEHTASLGAVEIPRRRLSAIRANAGLATGAATGFWIPRTLFMPNA